MKDYLGNTLEIGDECVIIEPNYRNFLMATITSFTPQNIKLIITDVNASCRTGKTILQGPCQVIKVTK